MTGAGVTSPGTRKDVASGRALAQLHPFFGVSGSAERFVDLALTPFLAAVRPEGRTLTCLDVGGGEGVVAAAFQAACRDRGLACDVTVLDENPQFLDRAARRGLQTHAGALSQFATQADCAILRFVNHYNSLQAQIAMAQDLARLLRPGGVLAAQIETGDDQTCRLHERIAEALAPEPDGQAQQHWPTLAAFREMVTAAGFEVLAVRGEMVVDETPVPARLEMAWRRRYGDALDSALISGNSSLAITILNAREAFLGRARAILNDAGASGTLQTIQPILVFRRVLAEPSDAVLRKETIDE